MKKNKLLIKFLFFCIVIFFDNIHAQNKLFKYDLEYKSNPRKDSITLKKMVLDSENGKSSVFRTEHDRRSDSLIAITGLGLGRGITLEDQIYVIKNFTENITYKSIQNIYRDLYSIKIIEKLNWEILSEKSKIENFNVQKAKVTYGGRNWIAWFTTEIPIQDGPYVFNGLPGLIVNLSDDQNNYIFNLTEIKNGSEKIYYRNKGTELNWEQFKKLAENYYSDPYARMKSMGVPIKKDDGAGNAVSLDLKLETDRIKKVIRNNNNPIELNHKIDYQ
ncbi:GLPGLI family protein [Chryseobacterium turcicum]|uniref:GLPGLI family protein n=1 Tax=Chryseobacterium turcicum TaxID=2898076 RepID=A0A9Q3YVX3_9FLAO|nr:GLPGLI family protein [Chryseobacterium turcicum]MCD1117343.1 GLPGLI family protein [Chryseobacterium turcicum]